MKNEEMIVGMPHTDNAHYHRIMEVVKDSGFSLSLIGTCGCEKVYISRGIDAAIFLKELSAEEVLEDIHQFLNGNYGNANQADCIICKETGIYESTIGKQANDGAIIIKRLNGRVLTSFSFES